MVLLFNLLLPIVPIICDGAKENQHVHLAKGGHCLTAGSVWEADECCVLS